MAARLAQSLKAQTGMLKFLQVTFLIVVAVAVACFSTWRFFRGGAWWLAAVVAVLAYAALLSGFFFGSRDAWHRKAIRLVFDFALSNEVRAGISLAILTGITSYLGFLAYDAIPADTSYYEVRVYEKVDLPTNYHVGAKVTVHSKTDGLTHLETVGDDGSAEFRSLPVPTTITYQLELTRANVLFVTGGNDEIVNLPALLPIDTATIPDDHWLPLTRISSELFANPIPRPVNYLLNVDERGDQILQTENAPWGVPQADLVLNRLGYVLGYDLERKLARWVAYSIGPTEQSVPRTQTFIADPAIPIEKQASVLDYRRSGYDRGHLISPADLFFKGPVTVQEAFYISTVAPQTPWLNRRLWRDVEVRVREAVESRQQPAFVIAGPLFIIPNDNPGFEFDTIGDGQIEVPTHFFRIIAMTTEDQGIDTFGLIVPNANDGTMELTEYLTSVRDIENVSGLTFFPLLDRKSAETVKARVGTVW